MGTSHNALSIQNPSQTGPRTHCDRDAEIHGVGSAISVTETDEECAVIGTIAIYVDNNAIARVAHMGRRSNVAFPQRKRSVNCTRKSKGAPFEATARSFAYQTILSGCACLLLELHVEATASRVDSNALLRGGKADYHTGMI
jgi:hypothetical protein